MRILFLGDLVGSIGISAASDFLPLIRQEKGVDFVIVNGENASRGKGLTHDDYERIASFADVITLGNHYRSKEAIDRYINYADKLIRPLNLLHYGKGEGSKVFECKGHKIRVTNILGAVFMTESVENPVSYFEGFLKNVKEGIHIVDFHGEATSEKQWFANYFDGLISASIGTHTHVPTADWRLLPKGTFLQCDAGYCGAYDAVLGFDVGSVIDRFVKDLGRIEVPESGRRVVYGTILDIDEESEKVVGYEPICYLDGKELDYGPSRL